MDLKDLVKSIRSDVNQGAFDKEEIILLCDKVEELLNKPEPVRYNELVGKEIKNFYCNGFFGRRYDLEGAIIMQNTDTLITVRTTDGSMIQADTEGWNMRELVEDWMK